MSGSELKAVFLYGYDDIDPKSRPVERVELNGWTLKQLDGLLVLLDWDEDYEELGTSFYIADQELQAGHDDPLTLEDLYRLKDYHELLKKRGPLGDKQALNLLHYMLSAPEWSVSFLEDARAIVARTHGRDKDVNGAQWDRH